LDLNTLIAKIPRPLLVFVMLAISLAFFVYNDPLKDECEVQSALFDKKTLGVLTPVRLKEKKKIQFPQINYWQDRCKQGNSIGSCEDYFEGLRLVVKDLRDINDKCQIKYAQNNTRLVLQISQALQIMALVAWGEKPPTGVSERLGWLNEANVKTFCYLKKTFILMAGEQSYLNLREKVYREYPDQWPETIDFEKRSAENRPRAYKSPLNPVGTLTKDRIYERSLFSVKCDLYM
jgi:hypothetical protein